MSDGTTAPPSPEITAHTRADGTGELRIGDDRRTIAGPTIEQTRAEIIRIVSEKAVEQGMPLQVLTDEPDGRWTLVVHPTGAVEETDFVPAGAGTRETSAPGPRRSGSPAVAPISAVPSSPPPAALASRLADSAPRRGDSTSNPDAAEPDSPASEPVRRRPSFLTPERVEEPAATGWRGIVTRLGLRVGPGKAERGVRADERAVSQHWPGKRTIAVVNGKGGAGKTPTTILTAATFARYGGAGVLAWDNNQTRGTLGWRTEQGPHDATLHELLPETDRLLGTGAQAADLARYVHHQTRDRYDVLRSKPMVLADEQRIESSDVDAIHAVAAKYYRLIVMDSGNDESDPMWRRMIDHTDQLVVATTTRAEHAEAGALLLEALAGRDERSAALAAGAVVVVSQADPKATWTEVRDIAEGYASLAREVVTIPYDSAMGTDLLHVGGLRPTTQRAWLAVTAAIARGL